ncbi:unnamed protein product [Linum tenue]|uniref:Uncharacterized protein n=1 Tax=Linum tenue TaxID=586396 RepID=A0AAV0L3X8_9ROSI|nr:unnamed protein product [Linum tenue]
MSSFIEKGQMSSWGSFNPVLMTKTMSRQLFLLLLGVLGTVASAAAGDHIHPSPKAEQSRLLPFSRASFPDGFLFGAGTAAYQSEGAASGDGKGPSIWDTFVKQHPEKIMDHSTGDLADNFYKKYKEDIKLMKKIGLDSFRFSISWSRILPNGKLSGGVNQVGVTFYNDLIDELLANGIKPLVTLWHFDLPQALEDEYGGFLSPKIVGEYLAYANLCFKTFSDRVKLWVTMNEPNGYAVNAYNTGNFAPGRCSKYVGSKYKSLHKGDIGITIVTNWYTPKYNTPSGRAAASRAIDFFFGWYVTYLTSLVNSHAYS